MVANKPLLPKGLVLAAVLSGLVAVPAWSEPVEPLKPEDCDRVRRGLEDGLPFGPGFRRMEVEFPNNDKGIEGQVCRLLTLGTGVHMEGPKIRSLKAMGQLVRDALGARGWAETVETAKFAETSSPGRQVFALSRKNAICVTTVVIDGVRGIAPMIEQRNMGRKHARCGIQRCHLARANHVGLTGEDEHPIRCLGRGTPDDNQETHQKQLYSKLRK